MAARITYIERKTGHIEGQETYADLRTAQRNADSFNNAPEQRKLEESGIGIYAALDAFPTCSMCRFIEDASGCQDYRCPLPHGGYAGRAITDPQTSEACERFEHKPV